MIVNTSDRISTPTITNDIPTHNEHSFATPESNININELWLQSSQFSGKTKKEFGKLHESNLRIQYLINLQSTTFHTLQEGFAKLIKASEETKKRINQVLKEQYHCKKDREYPYHDMNKVLNAFQDMKPQSQGHLFCNTPHLRYDIQQDSPKESKHKAPSQHQNGENRTYS
ncbi:hypothetical protein O181_093920 [Austropuccinia psidii MF-1]|uniref:Uncharacterized protein n=1 Tax=Austropuccinia psidii MF-1 TaxID=1389203 RepID=A0A9Q3J150_9BASI|nr:hypothetical protein [Austropuccinia psidii MF-1]